MILQLLALSRLVQRPLWRLGVIPMIWLMVVVSYAYGHAFAAQGRFEQSRLSRIVGAASVLQARAPEKHLRAVAVEGTMPRSTVLQNPAKKFHLIDRLIPPLLDGNTIFSMTQLRLHGLQFEQRRQSQLKTSGSDKCELSIDAICTSEFSLQRIGDRDLLLQLNPKLASKRPRT
ncbi:putative prophage domain protein [Synechococcus sp. BIOS-E4-1]|nr:putative prophage domain protein [Synechococcus sp. BIOS-E4-1]